jgi:predicted ATPase
VNFLRKLFDRNAARKLKIERAYATGRSYAIAQLAKVPENDVLDVVRSLRYTADGAFNDTAWEAAFDRGIRDICNSVERDLGSP